MADRLRYSAHLRSSAPWLLLALLCCSSNDDPVEERHEFADAQGRSCQATLERNGASSPVVFSSIACSGEARRCSSESVPCFQLSVDPQGTELRNCPACCKGSASSFFLAECSPVVCQTDADCVYADARCEAGICVCPNGRCE